MKKVQLIFSVMALALSTLFTSSNRAFAQYDNYNDNYYEDDYNNGSYQTFYDELSPHGNWIQDPQHGYVWVPNVGQDFRPYYTNGRWAMTDYGNMWISDYSWGWAPFHYGRWTFDPYYGWVWIPGRQWAPAWVSWRNGGGHYGWAPLGPNINISINLGGYNSMPMDWWVFIPQRHIYGNWHQSAYWGPRYRNLYNQTTIINNNYHYNNNYYFSSGPRRNDIERVTNQRANVYQIRESRNPQRTTRSGNQVNVYRPQIADRNNRTQPRNVVETDRRLAKNMAHVSQANNGVATRFTDREAAINRSPATPMNRNRPAANRTEAVQQNKAAVRSSPSQTENRPEINRSNNQRVEQQRMEQQQRAERANNQRVEQQRLEQQQRAERANNQRVEQQRMEQQQRAERANNQRVEQQRLEQQQRAERANNQRVEQQRLEQQQRAQRANNQRVEQQRMEQQQRAERANNQRMQQQRRERSNVDNAPHQRVDNSRSSRSQPQYQNNNSRPDMRQSERTQPANRGQQVERGRR